MEKLFRLAEIRDLDQQVTKGEISYSRMVEILNEKHFMKLVELRGELQSELKSKRDVSDEEIAKWAYECTTLMDMTSRAFAVQGAMWMRDQLSLPTKELKPLSEISDEDCINVAKCFFPKMDFEIKRYEKNIYYLDIIEKTESKSKWRINIFWLKGDIKLWNDSEGRESIEKGGIEVFRAYQYLQSKNYELPKYY